MRQIFASCVLTAAALLMSAAPAVEAAPVTFEVTAQSFTPGAGYGNDGVGGTLLDVDFVANGLTASFVLNNPGDSVIRIFGSVRLNEFVIGATEVDGLGVTANFLFGSPLSGVMSATATGTAILGGTPDGDVDLTIDWDPVVVPFGNGGSFLLSLDDLLFDGRGLQAQRVTIQLLTAEIPEPATLSLVGLSLAGLGWARRRRA